MRTWGSNKLKPGSAAAVTSRMCRSEAMTHLTSGNPLVFHPVLAVGGCIGANAAATAPVCEAGQQHLDYG